MEKYTEATNKIFNELLKHRKGIWAYKLAKLSEVNPNSIYYYLFGQIKQTKTGEKRYGGYLKNDIELLDVEGRNKKIKLKEQYFKKKLVELKPLSP